MLTEEKISLDCPYCKEAIYKPLGWFKQTYSTCPRCEGGVTADQFAAAIDEIEQTLDATIEEIVIGKAGCNCSSGCCGDKKG